MTRNRQPTRRQSKCAVSGCRRRSTSRGICNVHWRGLPDRLRTAIYNAFYGGHAEQEKAMWIAVEATERFEMGLAKRK